MAGIVYLTVTGFWDSHDDDGIISKSYNQAYACLDKARQFTVKGDLDNVYQKPSIRVGDEYLGNLEEEGIINWKIKLLIGKNEAFYLKYADFDDSGPQLCKDGRPTATRFDYLYPDEEIAGFAEETVVTFCNSEKKYVYLFYGDDKKEKSYYYTNKDGWNIYDKEGKVLVTADYEYSSFNGEYIITVTSHDSGVDLKDKIFLCSMVLSSVESNHHQG